MLTSTGTSTESENPALRTSPVAPAERELSKRRRFGALNLGVFVDDSTIRSEGGLNAECDFFAVADGERDS